MAKIKWDEAIKQGVEVIKSFINIGVTPTVRTVFYGLVSKEILPNTMSAYKGLSKNLVKARKDGVVSWRWIADETRGIYGEIDPKDYDSVETYSENLVNDVFDGDQLYSLPRWLNQKYYVELWIEKFALAQTFVSWTKDLKLVLVPSRGYSSWTFLYRGANRLKYYGEDKKKVILYFGDFDPSGKDIQRFLEEALRWFGAGVIVNPIAVNKEQIEEYNLPSAPEDSAEIAKMHRDPRYASWEHGLFRVELDALMAFVPEEFERIIKESIAEYFDESIYEKVLEREKEAKVEVKETILDLLRKRVGEDEVIL